MGEPLWRGRTSTLPGVANERVSVVVFETSPFTEVVVSAAADFVLLRRVLGEYVQGNQIIDGYWYSPDETGAPHYRNQAATADEMSLWLSIAEEVEL